MAKEAIGILEHRFAQREKTLHIPMLDVALERIDVNAEIEVVTHELIRLSTNLEHVEPFENENVGLIDSHGLAIDNVVHDVAVDGRGHDGRAALEFAQELQQTLGVVALGEALAVHDAALLKNLVGIQKAVGGDEAHLRMIWPTCQQCLQNSSERALANGDTAGNSDDVWHL